MVKTLNEFDLTALQKYRLSREEVKNSFTVSSLLEKEFLTDFMKKLAHTIGAPSEKVAASIFIKRYAFVAVISLFAMTAGNKKLNVKLDNIEMEQAEHGKDWLPKISFKNPSFEEWNGLNRLEWRRSIFSDLFANNIYPLINQLEKTFNLSRLILWENIGVYLFWLYETELKEKENPHVEADFHFLIHEAEGRLFGGYHLNPLQKYFSDKKYLEEYQEDVRIRKTCCFTYQLESCTKRCKTCPCTYTGRDGRCYDGESICSAVRSIT